MPPWTRVPGLSHDRHRRGQGEAPASVPVVAPVLTLVTGRGSLPARMHPSLLLQPRAGSPSWPSDPAPPADGADAAAAAAPGVTPAPGTAVTTAGGDNGGSFAVTTPSGYLSQETCQQASRSGLIAAAGYTVGASLIGIVIFVVMRKKLWGSASVRYLTAIGVACLLGTVVAGLDPVRADVLEQCMQSADFSQYVFLGTQLFARALVLGLIPTLAVTLTGCLVANRT